MESAEYLVDTHELTRSGQTVHGQVALSQFKRLGSDLPDQGKGMAQWSVRGLTDITGQQALEISVAADVNVRCQRCMETMVYPVKSTSVLQVMQSEAELDAIEDQQDVDPENWVEPVLASSRLNVLDLVEDELILGLPYVPMHGSCTHEAFAPAQDDEDASHSDPSPFAVLTQLKKN